VFLNAMEGEHKAIRTNEASAQFNGFRATFNPSRASRQCGTLREIRDEEGDIAFLADTPMLHHL